MQTANCPPKMLRWVTSNRFAITAPPSLYSESDQAAAPHVDALGQQQKPANLCLERFDRRITVDLNQRGSRGGRSPRAVGRAFKPTASAGIRDGRSGWQIIQIPLGLGHQTAFYRTPARAEGRVSHRSGCPVRWRKCPQKILTRRFRQQGPDWLVVDRRQAEAHKKQGCGPAHAQTIPPRLAVGESPPAVTG